MGEIASDPSVIATSLKESITQYNPDSLINRKGYQIIDKMRIDEAVKSALTLKKQAVIAPGWTIEPASDDPKDIEIAEFVEFALSKMRGSISNMLMQILLALDYGFSINEIVWKIYEDGPYKGKVGLTAIKSKKPHYYDFKVDQFGNLDKNGIVVSSIAGGEQELPVSKFIVYTYQKEFSNWYGQSDLRPAYRSWWSKDALIKFWNIYLEKFGQPTAWGRHKQGDATGRSDMQAILDKLQTSTNIVSTIGDFEIELLEGKRDSTGDYKEALHYHDRGIARSILIPDRLSEAGETGAFSQALVHFDVFLWVVKCLRLDLEELCMEEQLIRRLVAFNFSDVEELPKFKFKSLTDEQTIELAKTFADVVQKGAVKASFEDENKIREILGFPEKSEEDIVDDVQPEVSTTKTDKNPEDQEIEDDEKKSMAVKFVARDKTRFEKTVDFQSIEKELNTQEEQTTKSLQEILDKQKGSVIKFVTNKMTKNALSTKDVLDLDLKFKSDQKKVINTMFEDLYNLGKKDSRKELPKNFATTGKQGQEVAPSKALKFLQDKTDFVVKGINDPLTGDIQRALINAIDTGQSIPNTIKAIEDAYRPYLEDGSAIVDRKQLEPFRLEAIVRTNMSQAYNQGRRAIGEDPDVKDFVLGYQFSEIIDSRTAEVSISADGNTIRIDDPRLPELTYPLHWNDRGLFVFITSDEVPIEWTSDAELDQLLSMVRTTKP
jgi:phage gp29-like protein